TDYVKLGGGIALDTLRLDGAWMASRTATTLNESGVFADFSTLKADGWALTLTDSRFAADGHLLGLHVTQPLAVTAGSATLHLATGWRDDAPLYTREVADLSVPGRETSLELFHRYEAA